EAVLKRRISDCTDAIAGKPPPTIWCLLQGLCIKRSTGLKRSSLTECLTCGRRLAGEAVLKRYISDCTDAIAGKPLPTIRCLLRDLRSGAARAPIVGLNA
ncbi:hypothetical protein, partial [Pseudomonas triticifolii]|uniref:hypothetical protein n=1 Tax=Pseudomonas triticifolii TaxID=2762592 RepID=UPI0038B592D0